MNRRHYLNIAGAGLLPFGGCLGTHDETTSTTTRSSFPNVEVNPDPVEEDWPFDVEVVVAQQYSIANPAKIRVRFTNEASEEREFTFGAAIPFGRLLGDHLTGDENIYLIPEEDEYVGNTYAELVPESADDTCWRPTSDFVVHPILQHRTFEPGETYIGNYALLSSDAGTCLRAGRYRFDREEYEDQKEWGFDVLIEY